MYLKKYWIFLLSFCILAEERFTDFKKAYEAYQVSDYLETLNQLNQIQTNSQNVGFILYWKGIVWNRLQEFDKACQEFKKAISFLPNTPDLYYEYGQALYATKDLKEAIEKFSISAAYGYKKTASLYYIGYIYQLLEKPVEAKRAYQKVILEEGELKQLAYFEICSIEFEEFKTISTLTLKNKFIREKTIPCFEKVAKIDPFSQVAAQADEKIGNARTLIHDELAPIEFKNGVKIEDHELTLQASQSFGYDSNVIARANASTLNVTRQSSSFVKTSANLRKGIILGRSWIISSILDGSFTHYLEKKELLVAQNNNIYGNLALQSRYETFLYQKPTATLLEMEVNRFFRNNSGLGKLDPYGNTYLGTIGQRFSFISPGNTTFKVSYRQFNCLIDSGQTAKTFSIQLEQMLAISQYLYLRFLTIGNLTRAKKSDFSRNDLTFGVDIVLSSLFWNWQVISNIQFGFIDPIYAHATRGLEKLINPNVSLLIPLSRNASLLTTYVYMKNISKDLQHYAYSKEMISLSGNLQF